MEKRLGDYLKGVQIPALNRAGVKPVGVFTVAVGSDAPTIHTLLLHPSAESMATLLERLAADADYRRDSASFRGLPASDPPYVRRESTLMAPFVTFPGIEAPTGPVAAATRVFELRTYESHNEGAGLKKIEMFEKQGEIALFRRVGLTPVFFGRNLVGSGLPGLTYLSGLRGPGGPREELGCLHPRPRVDEDVDGARLRQRRHPHQYPQHPAAPHGLLADLTGSWPFSAAPPPTPGRRPCPPASISRSTFQSFRSRTATWWLASHET